MNNIKTKVFNLITLDVKRNNETKEYALLIRLLVLIHSFYYLVLTIVTIFQGLYFLGLLNLISTLVLIFCFHCTYKNRITHALFILVCTIILTNSALAYNIDYSINYHWLIYNTLLIVFFNIEYKLKTKIYFSTFIAFYMIFITIYSSTISKVAFSTDIFRFIISSFNIIVLVLSSSLIAFFYRLEFSSSQKKIKNYQDHLIELATKDTLTRLLNRHAVNEVLQSKEEVYLNTNTPFCIAIGDIDFFKSVNDTYGHLVGDYVLKSVSNYFNEFMKDKGCVARWGGEEFLFVFYNSNIGKSHRYLTEICTTINDYKFHYESFNFHVSMTFGLQYYSKDLGLEGTIKVADTKLYYGKQHGRNQVVTYDIK